VRCEDSIPGGTSCYILNNTQLTFLQAQKACQRNTGAYLVAWNNAGEQLRVEQYFKVDVAWLNQLGRVTAVAPTCMPRAKLDERLWHAPDIAAGDGPHAFLLLDRPHQAGQPVLLA
jgi:hypothetical protein